jgi:hypothetical protein
MVAAAILAVSERSFPATFHQGVALRIETGDLFTYGEACFSKV